MTDDDRAELSPAEAFGVLGDETRVAIVRALAEAEQPDEEGLSFSELRQRVGVRDAGQFNYHLSKLRDRFVVKRDDGYHPQYAALRAVGAIHSGSYTEDPQTRAAEVDSTCPDCEEPMTAEYEAGFFTLSCDEHGKTVQTAVPPSAAEGRTLRELASYVNAEVQRDLERALDGVCPTCRGPITVSEIERREYERTHATLSCEACWLKMQFPISAAVTRHPAVVSLFDDHGVDVRTKPLLSLPFVRDPDSVTVVDDEPFRSRVDVALDGDTVSLTLDGDLNVLEVEES
jgi:DNA-binding transcriptional ArsR family regulator